MSDHSASSEIKTAEQFLLAADSGNSAWLVDLPMLDANFVTADPNIVLSCPPSWIHSDPADYERLSEGESSDDSSQIDESIASEHNGSGSVGAPDSEFIIPPLSSSPSDPLTISSQDENSLFDSVHAHIVTPLLSPKYDSPMAWSFPRRGPFLVSIDSQNPGSPASLSVTTLSPMSSRSISFQPSQTSEIDLYSWEGHLEVEHFASKLHDLLVAVQRERGSDMHCRRLFRAPSEESQQDPGIGDVQNQFTQVEYHPYSPAHAERHSSLKRKRSSRSGIDGQEVFRTSQDYLPFGRYRLIKRAASYQASMFGKERIGLPFVDTPPSKRRKTSIRPLGTNNVGSGSYSPAHSPSQSWDGSQHSRTASFRRAESLRVPSSGSSPLFSPCKKREVSKPRREDDKENLSPYVHHVSRRVEVEAYTPLPPANQRGSSGAVWVPTVPSTPSDVKRGRVEDISTTSKPRRLTRKSVVKIGLQSPVPIIAPPKDIVWRMPLTPSAEAKRRLRTYLEREHHRDKRFKGDSISDAASNLPHETKICWERSLGLGKKTRQDCVAWLLTVMPGLCPKLNGGGLSPGTRSQSITTRISSSSSSSTSTVTQEFDDPESELDFTLTQFLSTPSDDQYNVYNPEDPEVSISSDMAKPSLSSARSKTSPDNKNKDQDMSAPSFNLSDQLQHSPETRFHAVWMFLRYFWLIDYGTQSDGFDADGECVYPGEDTEEKMLRSLLIWDAAVGSLALSVKLHRDFLDPLLPVYADEYLDLAPHSICMEDFENAQRDIFSALDYMLGDTPQPIMDELWRALPSLRQLLDFGSGKRHGWAIVMRHTWDKLFACLTEPDVLRFSVSHLTTVSLMDSVLYYVKSKLLRESVPVCGGSGNLVNNDRDPHGRGTDSEMEDDECLGVLCDIQSLVGFTDAQIQQCRLWMQRNETSL